MVKTLMLECQTFKIQNSTFALFGDDCDAEAIFNLTELVLTSPDFAHTHIGIDCVLSSCFAEIAAYLNAFAHVVCQGAVASSEENATRTNQSNCQQGITCSIGKMKSFSIIEINEPIQKSFNTNMHSTFSYFGIIVSIQLFAADYDLGTILLLSLKPVENSRKR
jgi:hypothetical protein